MLPRRCAWAGDDGLVCVPAAYFLPLSRAFCVNRLHLLSSFPHPPGQVPRQWHFQTLGQHPRGRPASFSNPGPQSPAIGEFSALAVEPLAASPSPPAVIYSSQIGVKVATICSAMSPLTALSRYLGGDAVILHAAIFFGPPEPARAPRGCPALVPLNASSVPSASTPSAAGGRVRRQCESGCGANWPRGV